MKLPDFIIKLISEGTLSNYVLLSDGGTGKSCGMLESYRRILAGSYFYMQKKVIPVFVMANQLYLYNSRIKENLGIRHYNNTIRSSILKLCGNGVVLSEESHYQLDNAMLDMSNFSHHFLIFVDGINECRNVSMLIEEIEQLASFKNVSLIISSRNEHSVLKNNGFSEIRVLPIEDEVISTLAPEIDESSRELLSRPFYLSKYIELKQKGAVNDYHPTNAFDLIDYYIKWSINKQRAQWGDEAFADSFLIIVSYVCFEMARKSVFFISKDIWDLAYKYYSEDNYFATQTNVGEKDFRQNIMELATSIGLFVRSESYNSLQTNNYRISHEIFRDYFMASFIRYCIDSHSVLRGSLFRCSPDTISMLASSINGSVNFTNKSGHLCIPSQRLLSELGYAEYMEGSQFVSFISTFLYVTYNLIESFSNGTTEKELFCEDYLDVIKRVYEKLKALWLLERIKSDYVVLEIVRIYSEILRRVGNYNESIDVSNFLIRMCTEQEVDYQLGARHNIVKCRLYEVFGRAKELVGNDIDRGLLSIYSDVLTDLKKLGDEGYSPSSNLYAMLLANPEPITGRYIDFIYAKETLEDRRLSACIINWNMFKKEYRLNYDDYSAYYYPLQQVLSAMVNGEVSWHTNDSLTSISLENAILDESALFTLFNKSYSECTKVFSKVILDHLCNKSKSSSLRLLLVKWLIAFDPSNIAMIKNTLNGILGIPLAKFINSVIKKDNDCNAINRIMLDLKRKTQTRAVDAFDAIYIQKDISRTWQTLCDLYGYDFSNEYKDSVKELLTLDLS